MNIDNDTSTWVVLIFEDDLDNLDLVQRVLSFHKVSVHTARNGTKGLEILEGLIPTFILMDLSMPEMDGWEVLEQIRSKPQIANLRVIALTANAMKGSKEAVLVGGFDGYISKPFQVATLIDQIRTCLKEADLRQTTDLAVNV